MIEQFSGNAELLNNREWLYAIDGLRRGKIAIRIDAEGRWYHEGDLIVRSGLVGLLESSLLLLDGRYFLRAPEQLLSIEVEDCPFSIVDFDVLETGDPNCQQIIVRTTSGIERRIDADCPLRLKPLPIKTAVNAAVNTPANTPANTLAKETLSNSAGVESLPVVLIRDGLEARFNRSSYYRLIELALEQCPEGASLTLRSSGESYPLS